VDAYQVDLPTETAASASPSPPAARLRRPSASCAQRALLHDLTNAAAGVQLLIDMLEGPISDETRSEYLRLLQSCMQQFHSRIDHEKKLLDQRNEQIFERGLTRVYSGTFAV
jgi:hypothetical protein